MPPKAKYEGFGFCPQESLHHFRVTISSSVEKDITVTENFSWDEESGAKKPSFSDAHDGQLKVLLSHSKWNAIADEVRADFNKRLKVHGIKAGQWKNGVTPLARPLGKELVLLCWAIEDAELASIPTAIRNWLGLAQEERWWLYTMTNAATGHAISGRNKGWRKAVRFALTENPITENVRHIQEESFLSWLKNRED
jgi:hypothetical protein